jgi:hypothetical protein
MTLLQRQNLCPPYLVRLCARERHGEKMISERVLSERTGLSRWYIRKLMRMRAWDRVPCGTYDVFTRACGVDPLHPHRHLEWLKRKRRKAWDGRDRYVIKLLKG